MVALEELDVTYLEDRFTGDIWEVVFGDAVMVDALLALHGWSGDPPKTVSRVADQFNLDPGVIKKVNQQYEGYAHANMDGRIDEAIAEIANELPFPIPLFGEWLHANGYTRLQSFPIDAFFDAADIYDAELPFRALSTQRTKWLVGIDGPELDGAFADQVAEKVLSAAALWGVIDVNHFDSILSFFSKAGEDEIVWTAIQACPALATVAGTGCVVSKHPRDDAKIVMRLDRLLSFVGAVPLPIALEQITRDGIHGVLPVDDAAVFEAFVRQCAYYDIEDGDVVSRRPLIVDEELSAREKPVVLALVERPHGATISELAAATSSSEDSGWMREVILSSPLIVALPDDRYALLDPSMYVDLLEEDRDVSTPKGVPAGRASFESTNERSVVDLAAVGQPGKRWWAMHAGPIPERNLEGARERRQEYMPIIDPGTKRCIGMVRTSRVYNKMYRGGVPTVLARDKGIMGRELPRHVTREALMDALSEAPFVFYNDPTKVGEESWGIVQRQDIGWQ